MLASGRQRCFAACRDLILVDFPPRRCPCPLSPRRFPFLAEMECGRLCAAVLKSDLALVRELCEGFPQSVDGENEWGQRPLTIAVQKYADVFASGDAQVAESDLSLIHI